MFEDSLFDSGGASRKRKTWPKLVSFVIEVGAISLLVLAPLIYTQGLPQQQILFVVSWPPSFTSSDALLCHPVARIILPHAVLSSRWTPDFAFADSSLSNTFARLDG